MITFNNEFGEVILTPVTGILNISQVSFNSCKEARENSISITDAEKVALITKNHNVQMGFNPADFHTAYVIYHVTPNTVQICNVDIVCFNEQDDSSPAEIINESNRSKLLRY